jgi:hypothetical protein
MAYKLTLTESERAAFDWIGGRYSNGNDMRKIIEQYPVDQDSGAWDNPGTVTFDLPEHAAWEILELAEQDDRLFPCFASELKLKMLSFIDSII